MSQKQSFAKAAGDACRSFEGILALLVEAFDTNDIDIYRRFDAGHQKFEVLVRRLDHRDTEPGYEGKPYDRQNRYVREVVEKLADTGKHLSHPSDLGVSYDDWVMLNRLLTKAVENSDGCCPDWLTGTPE